MVLFHPSFMFLRLGMTSHWPKGRRKRRRSHRSFSAAQCSTSVRDDRNAMHRSLSEMTRARSGEKLLTCPEFDSGFNQKRHLEAYQDVPAEGVPSANSVGGKTSRYRSKLKRHVRFRMVRDASPCPECGKSFTRKQHLKAHMRTHTGQVPFRCPVCDKAIRYVENMKRHVRTHNGEKPFACPNCDEAFIQKTQLEEHMIVHTGKMPFSCSLCGRTFARKWNAEKHTKTHAGSSAFVCSSRRESLKQGDHLKSHGRAHKVKSLLNDDLTASLSDNRRKLPDRSRRVQVLYLRQLPCHSYNLRSSTNNKSQ